MLNIKEYINGGILNVSCLGCWKFKKKNDSRVIIRCCDSHGTVTLSDPDESNFTAYASITEENAINWVKSALGSTFVSETETSLEQQILGSKNSNEKDGLPWGATTHF